MINKLELLENYQNHNNLIITIDFLKKTLIYIKDSAVFKNVPFSNTDETLELLKKYILYWDNEYIDNSVIDGIETQLIITTNDEVIKYTFKNKYPVNYYKFLEQFKTIVGVI